MEIGISTMKKSLLFAGVVSALSSFAVSAGNTTSVNVKANDDSAVVTVDKYYKVSFGGRDNLALYSTEFQSLVNDDKIKYNTSALNKLLAASLFDRGWSNVHGVDNVTVDSLGQTHVTFGLHNDGAGTTDSVTFFGTDVETWLAANAKGNIDIKDPNSRLAVFNADASNSNIWIGGGKSDAKSRISEEFANITGGSKIHGHEVLPLLKALVVGKPGDKTHHLGVDGVTLLGVDSDSFTIALHEGSNRAERMTIQGPMVVAAIAELKKELNGRPLMNIGDGVGNIAVWNTDSGKSVWLGNIPNSPLKTLVGGDIKTTEVAALVNALMGPGLDGVSIADLSATSLTIRIERTPGSAVVDTLIITGVDLEAALHSYF